MCELHSNFYGSELIRNAELCLRSRGIATTNMSLRIEVSRRCVCWMWNKLSALRAPAVASLNSRNRAKISVSHSHGFQILRCWYSEIRIWVPILEVPGIWDLGPSEWQTCHFLASKMQFQRRNSTKSIGSDRYLTDLDPRIEKSGTFVRFQDPGGSGLILDQEFKFWENARSRASTCRCYGTCWVGTFASSLRHVI